jgi:putative ABC transport system permease protein
MYFVALRMLSADKAKYLGLVFAIAFSTFLLENQTSIFAGIMKRTANRILDVTDAEVWVMDPATQYFDETKALKDTDLLRVRAVPGVAWAVRLLKDLPVARTASGRFNQAIVIGLDDATLTGAPRRMLLGSWDRLREPNSIIIDEAGFRLLFGSTPLRTGDTLELNDRRATIVGISDAAAPFTNFPIMHARYSEAREFRGRERSQLSFVLARPLPGISPTDLANRISSSTGLRARSSLDFAWDCIRYYMANTGIPVNFGITIAIAIIVGLVVSGQTFYLFTVENLRQFAALKAIGVTNSTLARMVLLQATVAGFSGFAIGTGMAALFFETFSRQLATRGIILLWQNAAGVAVLMSLVVLLAAALSLRKVLQLEPAAVFRS